ncbi:LegC family aminotransferase [Williamwhitmania taraxaci]|uniref:GDP-perosamine synthase n=1 Tax=Williamwhitmania taraxaci TaxID=1640674 RepID=A0A1G6GGJ6_9BACT|nr:LegC family aminotransferase [Williamwhitmania taraxaci]SDB81138.1 aminotransferase, LLPSF_NHT_00031 family [Williamwhitmania taraxaci]
MTKNFDEIVTFIRTLYNKPEGFIALHEPCFMGNEKKYLAECIDTTFVSSVGPFVTRFEEMVATYTGAKHAIVCVNGTAALHMALMLVGVEANDEVITQPLTFIATANAISYTGAKPVFVDVDMDTLGMSPKSLSVFLEEFGELRDDGFCYNKETGRRISACVPMHTFGHPCRIDEIAAICKKYKIQLVEDAAESIGSTYKGKHTGTFGAVGILSFNGNKTITTGGGGMIITNNDDLGKRAKHLTTQAKLPHRWEFNHDAIGYNYRMPNINAALGVAQMEVIDRIIVSKRGIAAQYTEFFAANGIDFCNEPQDSISNYWLNSILLGSREERDRFLGYMNDNGIMSRPAWTLMNKLPMFEGSQTDYLKNAVLIAERLINLPSSVIS